MQPPERSDANDDGFARPPSARAKRALGFGVASWLGTAPALWLPHQVAEHDGPLQVGIAVSGASYALAIAAMQRGRRPWRDAKGAAEGRSSKPALGRKGGGAQAT